MTKEKSGNEKTNLFLLSGLIQQVQLCFLCIALFGFCQKYGPQYRHIFIIQQGSWYFENEVSSITNKGLLSGVCLSSHRGEGEGERGKRDPSACAVILQDYGHSGMNCSHISAFSLWRPDVKMTKGQDSGGSLHAAFLSHNPYLRREPRLSHKLPGGKYYYNYYYFTVTFVLINENGTFYSGGY